LFESNWLIANCLILGASRLEFNLYLVRRI
jgi:hypothetical protein